MPTPSPSEFQPYRRVQAGAETDLTRILEATARAIQKRIATLRPGVGGQVRSAQLTATLQAVRAMQRTMWTGAVSPTIQRGMDDAVKAAESAIEAMTRVAYASLPDGAAEALVRGLRASAESGLKSDAARRKRALSERIYAQRAVSEGKIDDLIRQGLIANLSAKELASSVYQYVSPTAPGGASYVAMRLARTEINNAFHERQIQGATRPGVKAVQWNLSGSHKVPDECNVYAAHKPYDPDKVPEKPHPQCFCYLTYVTEPAGQFQKDLEAGKFDDEIDRRTRENLARLGQSTGSIKAPEEVKPKAKRTRRKLAVVKDNPKTTVTETKPKSFEDRVSAAASDDEALTTPKFSNAVKASERPSAYNRDMQIAVGKYTGVNYKRINAKLRGLPEPKNLGTDDIDTTIRNLDAAMKLSTLDKDVVVYRGMSQSRTLFGDRLDNDLTGMEWTEEAYTSTTAIQARTNGFISRGGQDNVLMRIVAPKGTNAITASGKQLEAEVLIARGAKMRVVKDNGVDDQGIRHLDMEVDTSGREDEGTTSRNVQAAGDEGTNQSESTSSKALTGDDAQGVVPKGLFKRGTLTPDQRKQLKVYESGWFSVINAFLRGGEKIEDMEDQRTANTVASIDSAMDESVLPEDIQVWRGMFGSEALFKDDFSGDLTGFAWTELGYGSTTTEESVTNTFMVGDKSDHPKYKGKDVKMIVSVPKGTKALQTSTRTEGSQANGAQAEITLQRGLKWRVTKDHGFDPEKGYRVLEVQVSQA